MVTQLIGVYLPFRVIVIAFSLFDCFPGVLARLVGVSDPPEMINNHIVGLWPLLVLDDHTAQDEEALIGRLCI